MKSFTRVKTRMKYYTRVKYKTEIFNKTGYKTCYKTKYLYKINIWEYKIKCQNGQIWVKCDFFSLFQNNLELHVV